MGVMEVNGIKEVGGRKLRCGGAMGKQSEERVRMSSQNG